MCVKSDMGINESFVNIYVNTSESLKITKALMNLLGNVCEY